MRVGGTFCSKPRSGFIPKSCAVSQIPKLGRFLSSDVPKRLRSPNHTSSLDLLLLKTALSSSNFLFHKFATGLCLFSLGKGYCCRCGGSNDCKEGECQFLPLTARSALSVLIRKRSAFLRIRLIRNPLCVRTSLSP